MARTLICLEVLRTEDLTPHLRRVVLGGEGLADYVHNDFTDRYVKLLVPPAGVHYERDVDVEQLRADPDRRPRLRTYTVRSFDAAAGELAIDFVQHGDQGLAGPWAAAAEPGDLLHMSGPGGAYAPDPGADWHLFVGDEAALPAIGAALEALPDDAQVVALLEVEDPDETSYLRLPAQADVRWLVRSEGAPGLVDAVRALDWPDGEVSAFVHGELATMRRLREHLIDERGVPLERLSLSGYWRKGKDEEGFQAEKREESERLKARWG